MKADSFKEFILSIAFFFDDKENAIKILKKHSIKINDEWELHDSRGEEIDLNEFFIQHRNAYFKRKKHGMRGQLETLKLSLDGKKVNLKPLFGGRKDPSAKVNTDYFGRYDE